MLSPTAGGAGEVRKKWDALLSVINNVSGEGEADENEDQKFAARDFLQHSGSVGSRHTRRAATKRVWDDQHHLLYSTVNDKMQKNVRAYFDRPREAESYGLKTRDTLRSVWQLDTPEKPLGPSEVSPQCVGKRWQAGGSCCGGGARAAARQVTEGSNLVVGGVAAKRQEVLGVLRPRRRAAAADDSESIEVLAEMSSSSPLGTSSSAPSLLRELDWDNRHTVMFEKDNHHYHPNFRAYFERPRRLLH